MQLAPVEKALSFICRLRWTLTSHTNLALPTFSLWVFSFIQWFSGCSLLQSLTMTIQIILLCRIGRMISGRSSQQVVKWPLTRIWRNCWIKCSLRIQISAPSQLKLSWWAIISRKRNNYSTQWITFGPMELLYNKVLSNNYDYDKIFERAFRNPIDIYLSYVKKLR